MSLWLHSCRLDCIWCDYYVNKQRRAMRLMEFGELKLMKLSHNILVDNEWAPIFVELNPSPSSYNINNNFYSPLWQSICQASTLYVRVEYTERNFHFQQTTIGSLSFCQANERGWALLRASLSLSHRHPHKYMRVIKLLWYMKNSTIQIHTCTAIITAVVYWPPPPPPQKQQQQQNVRLLVSCVL